MEEIAIVGAGCCGLACALALGRRGYRLSVFDIRADPRVPEGVRDQERVTELLAEASESHSNENRDRLFSQARKIGARYWGTQHRNIILDAHSVSHLASLGVPTDGLPRVQSMDLFGPAGGPTFTADLDSQRKTLADAETLNISRLIWKRDWLSIVALNQVEKLLRDACERYPNIRFKFGCAVRDVRFRKRKLKLVHQAGETRARLVIVSDGGGKGSLTRRLGVTRLVHHSERIRFAVVEPKPDDAMVGRLASNVFAHNTLTPDGWFGLFSNGKTTSVAINAVGMKSGRELCAWTQLERWGVRTRFVEPPTELSVTIAGSRRVGIAKRLVLAGDAAFSGNPRSGLGVQFGLMWAQCVDHCVSGRKEDLRFDMKRYRKIARKIQCQRKTFELAWTELMDSTIRDTGALARYYLSDALMEAVSDFHLDVRSKRPNKLECRADLRLSSDRISPDNRDAVARFLRSVRRVEVIAFLKGRIETDGKKRLQLSFCLTRKHPLEIRYGDEALLIQTGMLTVARRKRRWRVSVHNAMGRQQAVGFKPTFFPMDHMRVELPDSFLSPLMLEAWNRSTAGWGKPLRFMTLLPPSTTLDVGGLKLRTDQGVTVNGRINGPVICYDVVHGSLYPANLTDYAKSTKNRDMQWIKAWSKLTGGWLDISMNETARATSNLVRRMELERRDDGSVRVSIYGPWTVEHDLDNREVNRLQAQMMQGLFLQSALTGNGSRFLVSSR